MNHIIVFSMSLTLVLCGGTTFAQQQQANNSQPTPFAAPDGYRGFADRLGAIDLGGELFDFESSAQRLVSPSTDQFSASEDGERANANEMRTFENPEPFRGDLAELGLADTLCSEQDQYEQDSNRISSADTETKTVSTFASRDTGRTATARRKSSRATRRRASRSARQARFGAAQQSTTQQSTAQSWNWAWVMGPAFAIIPLMALAIRKHSRDEVTHRIRTSSDSSTFIERKSPAMRMMSNFDTSRDDQAATWYPNEPKIGRPVASRDSRWPQERSRTRTATAAAAANASEDYGSNFEDDDLEVQMLEDTNAMTVEMNGELTSTQDQRHATESKEFVVSQSE